MTGTRASIFDTDDLEAFTPKSGPAPDALSAEQVRAIAEDSQFPSREAKPRAPKPAAAAAPKAQASSRRPKLQRVRTYRDQQINARASAETVDDFYGIAEQQGWSAAETMERAIAALKRETAGKGRGGT